MDDRIRHKELSVPVYVGDEKCLFDPHYDTVHLFRWLGHSITKVIIEGEGLAQIHAAIEYGEAICEAAGVEPFERTTIGKREYDQYLKYQASIVDDTWLE